MSGGRRRDGGAPSRYFAELIHEYRAELDDLATDSEGADVLAKRLKDKRREFGTLAALCAEMPLLVVPCFHGAFSFPPQRAAAFDELLGRAPGGFPSWAELAADLEIASWALPLVDEALAQDGGEDFLATAAGLEYARLRERAAAAAAPFDATRAAADDGGERDDGEGGDRDGDDEAGLDDDDGRDDETRGEDYLEDQGFDRRTGE